MGSAAEVRAKVQEYNEHMDRISASIRQPLLAAMDAVSRFVLLRRFKNLSHRRKVFERKHPIANFRIVP